MNLHFAVCNSPCFTVMLCYMLLDTVMLHIVKIGLKNFLNVNELNFSSTNEYSNI